MAIPLPLNEKTRLEVLHQLQILDSSPEVSYDELTKLAAMICDCPNSVISLIDENRQWFKSTFNVSSSETPRSEAICAYTILEPEILIVPNAHQDKRFNQMASVTGLAQLHFYAGVPIKYNGGFNLGAICVFDSKPHPGLSEFQIGALKGLATLASKLIDGRKSLIDLQRLNRAMIEAEKHLAHTEQMKELALMTGGVAHEINTPLSVIKMTLELLKESVTPKLAPNDKAISQIVRLEKATERIENLTHGLRTYSRDSRNDSPTETFFETIITDTLQFAKERLQKSGARLIISDFNPELAVPCNPVEISQVLLNLVHNACDAVKDLPQKWIRIDLTEISFGFELSVTDSGSGIPENVAKVMFEPFFTTKKINHGTGLGLSICRGIIERHHGTIEIDASNSNTRFTIRLPKQLASTLEKAG